MPREAGPCPQFPVQYAATEVLAGIPGDANPRCRGGCAGTSWPVLGGQPEGLQIRSQVVDTLGENQKKSASRIPLGKSVLLGVAVKFLESMQVFTGFPS